MPSVIQRTFAAGELSPALYARADLVKYQTGAKTVRNFMVRKDGAVTNRPGTAYITSAKDSATVQALIPFVFNTDQSYALVLGDQHMRFIRAGALVTISAPAAYNGATAYAVGDLVAQGGTNYYCKAATTGNAPPNATYWHPLTGTIFEIPTPWGADDLWLVQYVQSADVMTLVHPDYPPRELRRLGATQWTLTVASFAPSTAAPTNLGATAGGGAGAIVHRYRVTAVSSGQARESLPGRETARTITLCQGGTPITITTSGAHGYVTGDEVFVSGVPTLTAGPSSALPPSGLYTITVTGATTFTLDGTSTIVASAASGSVARTYARIDSVTPTLAAPNVVSWVAVAGATSYNVYRESNGVYGFIGIAGGTSFNDINILPDTSDNPPQDQDLFEAAGDYPAAVAYAQQRLAFAGSDNEPETVRMSRVGDFANFTISASGGDDDSIEFALAGRQVNEIRHMVEVEKLLVLTAGGVFSVEGDANGVITPTAINLKQQAYNGASTLRPLIVGNTVLYVQARASIVRDLRFSFQDDGYQGNDLSIYAGHLVAGRTIVDWAYQETPNSIVWMVLDNGALLGLTYVREQQVLGWHRHDTSGGSFENVCVIPEDGEDVLYTVVRREINGSTVRTIERMASRQVDALADAFFVDCGGTYDGTNTGATTLTLSGSGWTPEDTLTVTASAGQFVVGDVGLAYVLTIDGEEVVVTITGYTSPTVVSGTPDVDVPVAFQGVATAAWARQARVISGLSHLEGESVAVLADASVYADGTDEPLTVVTGGAITLDRPYTQVHVGLPIEADLALLNIENAEAETLSDKRLLINEATLLVESSLAPSVGADEDHLRAIKQRSGEAWGAATDLRTGTFNVAIDSAWSGTGQLFIRHSSPVPLTILAVVRRGRIEKAPQ